MGKRRRKKPKKIDVYCYFCEKEFQDETMLVQHQRVKHFTCLNCRRKFNSISAMKVHYKEVHNEVLEKVPNSIKGKESTDVDVYGMNGCPPRDAEVKKQKPNNPMPPVPMMPFQQQQQQNPYQQQLLPPFAQQQQMPFQQMPFQQSQMKYYPNSSVTMNLNNIKKPKKKLNFFKNHAMNDNTVDDNADDNKKPMEEPKNIGTIPPSPTKPIENLVYYDDLYSMEERKAEHYKTKKNKYLQQQ